MPHTAFNTIEDEHIQQAVADPKGRSRWLVLCGDRSEPMFDYMLDAIDSLPRRKNLDFALANPNRDSAREFLERHMVLIFPTILLIRRGDVHSMISGAIGFDQLDRAVDEICRSSPQDTVSELMANADDSPQFVQIGVSDTGLPIFARKSDLDD